MKKTLERILGKVKETAKKTARNMVLLTGISLASLVGCENKPMINPSLVKIKEITDDQIYETVKEFVSNKINYRIKEIDLVMRDVYSYDTLNDSKFEILSNPSSPRTLLEPYFEGELLDKAVKYVNYYPSKGEIITANDSGHIKFMVYLPSKYNLRAINPRYLYKELSLDFNKSFEKKKEVIYNSNTKKGEIFVIDKGEKVRAKPVIE